MESFSRSIKRRVLVAEDEYINRILLENILKDDYDVIMVSDGEEALDVMKSSHKPSIVLLDLQMPKLNGLELLRIMESDEELSRIPVLVQTSSQEHKDEIECLQLGAVDFVSKPYNPEVLKARVERVIELYEDMQTISMTERDELTGLLNREYFYRYARQADELNPDADMDACLVDVNHFHILNARYGKDYGDSVISKLGSNIMREVEKNGGLACRLDADHFLIYMSHGDDDYAGFLDRVSGDILDENESILVRTRMGVYPHVSKEIPLEQRFDRAKTASDLVRGSFTESIGVFDEALHNRELDEEQLIEDFRAGIDEKQFQVYYQPKYNIRSETPVLSSAEALVRWNHPKRGTVSPGLFIPLFENNGLIRELDKYVWHTVADQIRDWKREYGWCMPVSVNVSRIDLFDPELIQVWKNILSVKELEPEDFYLEITESAYTSDSDQIIENVKELRELGLQTELDDFGTGYSSLNMLSTLPVDVIKIDMGFVRNAFREGGNTSILQVIINIAKHLKKPVIAEGIETEEQLKGLKKLGCDIIQGYYFSKPVTPAEFVRFIEEKLENERIRREAGERLDGLEHHHISPEKAIEFLNRENGEEDSSDELSESSKNIIKKGVSLRKFGIIVAILAVITALCLIAVDIAVNWKYHQLDDTSERHITAMRAANELETGSDYLTDKARCFIVDDDIDDLVDYFRE
ncbi:MAG: EAL domain-containing protein, partial [Clostridia bacterium]|nr:EAL domain-containing protein [Clostridia bacterium]